MRVSVDVVGNRDLEQVEERRGEVDPGEEIVVDLRGEVA